MTREEFSVQLPELVKNYQPVPDVLSQIKNLEVLMIVGPSGVGKTTLIQNSGLAYVPSDTTRPPRPGEVEGEDFYFRTDYDTIISEIKNGRFVQVAVDPGGDFKATRSNAYPNSGVVIMAVVAEALPIFRSLGFKKTISAFITTPTYEEWMRRLLIHQLSPEQFAKRIDEAKRSLELSLNDPQMHFVLNDDLETAQNQLMALLAGNPDPNQEQEAKKAAVQMLDKLKENR